MSSQIEISAIAIMVAVACALPGAFLILRRMSMMSDSITHTILLGIVLAFFITKDLSSPLLILGAAAMGLCTAWLTETMKNTRLLSEDAAMGVVFPLLFSIAVILISRYAGSVHLDTDSVLLGELAFAPFDRLIIGAIDFGPKALYTSGVLLLINIAAIAVFFKELKLAAFDPILSAALGFAPLFLHYGLMALVSLTAVGAFQAVGSVLVVAFMTGPPLTAYLLTDKLGVMLLLSALFAAINGFFGYQAALLLDVSIAGSMAAHTGAVFFIVLIAAPKKGLLSALRRKRLRRKRFGEDLLLCFLLECEGEKTLQNMLLEQGHFRRERRLSKRLLRALHKNGLISFRSGAVILSEKGRKTAELRRAARTGADAVISGAFDFKGF